MPLYSCSDKLYTVVLKLINKMQNGHDPGAERSVRSVARIFINCPLVLYSGGQSARRVSYVSL